MKLGVIYEPEGANPYYRAIFPMQALRRRGHHVAWPTRGDAIPMREFLACDLVHCFRRRDRYEDLQALSRRGVAISFDNDDNFEAAEMSLGADGLEGHRRNQEVFRGILKAAQLADLTTTPSELLAERYRAAGADNVAVIENHVPRQMAGFGSQSKHEGVVLGWVASREHKLDLERVPILPALRRLLETHSDLRIRTIGVRLPLDSDRYEHVSFVEFTDLLKALDGLDIGIAPLADNLFNRSRSNVKLKEYSSVGAAWLASPVGPYLGLGADQGGLLVGDDDWYTAIDQLMRKPRLRKRLAKRALRWARAQTIDQFASRWEEEFRLAIERARYRSAHDAVARR